MKEEQDEGEGTDGSSRQEKRAEEGAEQEEIDKGKWGGRTVGSSVDFFFLLNKPSTIFFQRTPSPADLNI